MVEVSDLESKIIKQIEFYFGDANLGRDKFLQSQQKLDDGWITMETMLKFNRLKQLSDSADVVIEALQKATSGLIEMSEDKKKIRRSTEKPLPEMTKEFVEDLNARSIYAKGFPLDLKLDEAMTFFERFGEVDKVSMRRDTKKAFKGSCFTIFKSKEGATKFMDSTDTKYSDDLEMIKFYQEDYLKSKAKGVKMDKEEKKKAKERDELEAIKAKIVVGSILVVSGLAEDADRSNLKEFFAKHGKVQWADLDKDKKEARLRFSSENEATAVKEKMTKEAEDGVVKFEEQQITLRVLEGDEAFEHWKTIFESISSRQAVKRKAPSKRYKGGKRSKLQ